MGNLLASGGGSMPLPCTGEMNQQLVRLTPTCERPDVVCMHLNFLFSRWVTFPVTLVCQSRALSSKSVMANVGLKSSPWKKIWLRCPCRKSKGLVTKCLCKSVTKARGASEICVGLQGVFGAGTTLGLRSN